MIARPDPVVHIIMRAIEVVQFREDWAEIFEKEKELIVASLPLKSIVVHHIGSTSVRGLAAKPVIDILIEVEDVVRLDGYGEIFKSLDYECLGEFGIPGRRYYQKGGEKRSHHIHAFKRESPDAIRHIAFKEYLKAHESVANEYAELKMKVARSCNNDILKYCAGKADFVNKYEKLAVQWMRNA